MGFNKIYYQGKELKRDDTATTRTIVMQKNNPDRLDMRYKTNREWIKEQQVIQLVHDKIEEAKNELVTEFSMKLEKELGL